MQQWPWQRQSDGDGDGSGDDGNYGWILGDGDSDGDGESGCDADVNGVRDSDGDAIGDGKNLHPSQCLARLVLLEPPDSLPPLSVEKHRRVSRLAPDWHSSLGAALVLQNAIGAKPGHSAICAKQRPAYVVTLQRLWLSQLVLPMAAAIADPSAPGAG